MGVAASLGELFALRNQSVYPIALLEDFIAHPGRGHTCPELVVYNADKAEAL